MANFPRICVCVWLEKSKGGGDGIQRYTEQNRIEPGTRNERSVRQYRATSCLVLSYRYAVVPLLCSQNEHTTCISLLYSSSFARPQLYSHTYNLSTNYIYIHIYVYIFSWFYIYTIIATTELYDPGNYLNCANCKIIDESVARWQVYQRRSFVILCYISTSAFHVWIQWRLLNLIIINFPDHYICLLINTRIFQYHLTSVS